MHLTQPSAERLSPGDDVTESKSQILDAALPRSQFFVRTATRSQYVFVRTATIVAVFL